MILIVFIPVLICFAATMAFLGTVGFTAWLNDPRKITQKTPTWLIVLIVYVILSLLFYYVGLPLLIRLVNKLMGVED
jgi:antibiotic biosynthesis monooxygenase (ABM) superfamily enzyme